MTIQTSNHKLRKQALAEGIDFNNFVKYGIALEASSAQAQSTAQAQSIEKAEQSVNFVERKDNRRAYKLDWHIKPTTDQGSYVTFVGMIRNELMEKGNILQKGSAVILAKRDTVLRMHLYVQDPTT